MPADDEPESAESEKHEVESPEDDAIKYLREEIDWHRRAGRILVGFGLSALTATGVLLTEVVRSGGSPSAWVLSPIGVIEIFGVGASIVVVLVSGAFFVRYYDRIKTLQDALKSLLTLRLRSPLVWVKWVKTFYEWGPPLVEEAARNLRTCKECGSWIFPYKELTGDLMYCPVCEEFRQS